MSARAILTPRPNSHPFQERTVTLEQPLKIGRSVARSRPASNNAIFDCKVLSRNHALLWYEAGKFYLQDSKSSNGTFVNNVRLSKSSEESPPTPVSSGDVLQFGVDVMEVTKKVTHGCIVASLQLFTPDGKEAKAVHGAEPTPATTLQDLYALFQYLRDAAEREEKLETKLAELQKVLKNTSEGVSSGWKVLIEEDRLLARIDTLERQLLACHKTMTKEKLRDEVIQLNSDREKYQEAAKEALRKSLTDKLEVMKKCQELERALSAKEEDQKLLTERTGLISVELEQLASKYVESERKCESMTEQLQESSLKHKCEIEELSQLLKEHESHLIRDRFLQNSFSFKSSAELLANQLSSTLLNHNADADATLQNDIASTDSNLDFQDTNVSDASPPNEPLELQLLRYAENNTREKEIDSKTELSELQERLEEEKKGIITRLTYLISLFGDLKSIANKTGVSDYLKEIIGKVDQELRQVKHFTLGQDYDDLQYNNHTNTIETVPQPNLVLSNDLVNVTQNTVIQIQKSDPIKAENDDKEESDDSGLKKLLEESREMTQILKRENLTLVTDLNCVKDERENLRNLVTKFEEKGLEMSVVSGKNAELISEISSLKDVAAKSQREVRSLEEKVRVTETKVKGQLEALDAAETDNTYLRRVIAEQTLRVQDCEKLVQECKNLHNGVLSPSRLAANVSFENSDLSLKMQEMEEELAIFKDRYAASATECSRLSQKLQERDNQGGPFYMQRGFLVFILISLVLAVLIAFSPR